MTPEPDEATWRNRFILINLTRIGATIVVLLAILLWQSDVFVTGGSIVGLPIALVALVVSFFGPRYLAGRWHTPDEP
jgi:F0F1-type ATP synthase assembly protein I